MKHTERMCNIHKSHATPWTKSIGQATHSINYWDVRITQHCKRNNDDPVLDYYILRSKVGKEIFNTKMTVSACIHELINARSQLKDVLKDAKSNGSFNEVEVATERVEKNVPQLTEENAACAMKREDKIELETKARENRRNTQLFSETWAQIRGHVKPNTAKKSSLTRVMAPDDGP
jgi:hypothetical protein